MSKNVSRPYAPTVLLYKTGLFTYSDSRVVYFYYEAARKSRGGIQYFLKAHQCPEKMHEIRTLPSGLTVDTSPFALGPYVVNPNATTIDFTFFTITAPANYTGPFGSLPATIMILGDTSFEEITTTATNPLGIEISA